VSLDDDIAKIIVQEQRLVFPAFDLDRAWRLGLVLRQAAVARGVSVVIEVGLRDQVLFYAAMPGTTPDNADWIRRKRNTVLHFSRSSYRVGLELARKGKSLTDDVGFALRDYATHGGGFPLTLTGLGCIGAVIVSGLPQREDHAMVVQALAEVLDQDSTTISLD